MSKISEELDRRYKSMSNYTDGHNWYWLSYGEKCYAFAVVSAFPEDENKPYPPSGGRLKYRDADDGSWVAEDGTQMVVDEWLASVEKQSGGVICAFIAQAYADAGDRFA